MNVCKSGESCMSLIHHIHLQVTQKLGSKERCIKFEVEFHIRIINNSEKAHAMNGENRPAS
jgi:hypothetical protein